MEGVSGFSIGIRRWKNRVKLLMSVLNYAARAATVAFCVLGAGAATATTPIYLQTVGIYNPGTASITTGGNTENVYTSNVVFTASEGTAASGQGFDLIGFCVDIYHNISAGLNSQAAFNAPYHTADLLTDMGGNTLTSLQIREISGLATRGFAIQAGNSADKYADLAAIQGAIWTIEYPHSTVTATGGYSDLQSRINSFVALAPSLRGNVTAIYPTGGNTQGFVVNLPGGIGAGAVPEPASWALLIAGFGMVGFAARRRGTAMRTVTA